MLANHPAADWPMTNDLATSPFLQSSRGSHRLGCHRAYLSSRCRQLAQRLLAVEIVTTQTTFA